jgi:hypothetical protein
MTSSPVVTCKEHLPPLQDTTKTQKLAKGKIGPVIKKGVRIPENQKVIEDYFRKKE